MARASVGVGGAIEQIEGGINDSAYAELTGHQALYADASPPGPYYLTPRLVEGDYADAGPPGPYHQPPYHQPPHQRWDGGEYDAGTCMAAGVGRLSQQDSVVLNDTGLQGDASV